MNGIVIIFIILSAMLEIILIILFIRMANDVRTIKHKIKDDHILDFLQKLKKNQHIKSIDDYILLAIIDIKRNNINKAKENIFIAKYLIENDISIENKIEYLSQINNLENFIDKNN